MRRKVIIDTDPGVDDSMAIQLALSSPELELLGLTTIYGNADVERTTTNALRLLQWADRSDIPVAKGAASPLKRPFRGGVPQVHGVDGMGNTFQAPPTYLPIDLSATEFIYKMASQFPKEITWITLGPLTNVAHAVEQFPDMVDLLRDLVVMGGNAFCAGNATPAAEANVLNDPEAADLVFGLPWKMTMVGLDVTHRVFMSDADLDEIATYAGPMSASLSRAFVHYRAFYKKVNKIDGIYVHDSSAISYVLRPELFHIHSYPVRVERKDCIGHGKTWPSIGDTDHEDGPELAPWKDRPSINICTDVDGLEVVRFIKNRLSSSGL